MKYIMLSIVVIFSFLGCNIDAEKIIPDQNKDKQIILKTIEDWDSAWGSKNVELAIKDYAKETDWTNAFGDRVQSRAQLKQLLKTIFSLDFVMAGENNYVENEIDFITNDIALVKSQNLRKNQEWADGSKMADRQVNHLRVYKRIDDNWKIVSHMISQAHEKRGI